MFFFIKGSAMTHPMTPKIEYVFCELCSISFCHIPLGCALAYTRGKHEFNVGGSFHGCARPNVWFCCFYLERLCDSEQAGSFLKKQTCQDSMACRRKQKGFSRHKGGIGETTGSMQYGHYGTRQLWHPPIFSRAPSGLSVDCRTYD